MCGICGIVALSDAFEVDRELVERMRDTMTHRGPDDAGTWCDPSTTVAFGHRRLSIVDLSKAGRQPMSNEDGSVWITFNGEIYNHAELRSGLERRGHTYRSRTDTETIIHLFEERGARCVEDLKGMFAIAIWDARRKELFLARDRIGIKPLYYATPPGGFLFGSEIKALLAHPAITPDLDEEAFLQYLTFVSTPAPRTMFAGIHKLAPAERMLVRADGTIERETYWHPLHPDLAAAQARASEGELVERLLDLLRTSIRRRMMADVAFGVLLSGGVDSSTNVALMSELMDRPVRTFSVGFAGHERYNELVHARRIAELFATDHHEVMIGEQDLESFIPELIHHQDEPIADWVCVPLYYVAELAKRNGTTVVQVGEGSDELFHGYEEYCYFADRAYPLWRALCHLPAPLLSGASSLAASLAPRIDRARGASHLLGDARDRIPYWGNAISFRGDLKQRVLASHTPGAGSKAVVRRLWRSAEREHPAADLKQKMTYLELKQRLAELLLMRVDKMTMASAVEARVPFLDHELVEFAIALPPGMKARNGQGKVLLKRAMEGLLPHDLVYRRKQGFSAPVADWYRGELGQRAQRAIRDSSLADRGLLDYDYVDRLWRAHRSGRGDWGFQLWNLYNVSAWYDYWIAGRQLG